MEGEAEEPAKIEEPEEKSPMPSQTPEFEETFPATRLAQVLSGDLDMTELSTPLFDNKLTEKSQVRIVADFFLYPLRYSQDTLGISLEKSKIWLDVIGTLLKTSFVSRKFSMPDDFARFKRALDEIRDQFHPLELQPLCQDFVKSFFGHYDLYAFALTGKVESKVIYTDVVFQQPTNIQPLEQAIEEIVEQPVEESEHEETGADQEEAESPEHAIDDAAENEQQGEDDQLHEDDQQPLSDSEDLTEFDEIFGKVDRKLVKRVDRATKAIEEEIERSGVKS